MGGDNETDKKDEREGKDGNLIIKIGLEEDSQDPKSKKAFS